MGHYSHEWAEMTAYWKGRLFEYGAWAIGAFAIGVGVIPVIALLAVLAVPRAERAREGVRTFVLVAGAATVSFSWYAALKGAYLSTTFSTLIVERNLIYLTPLAFVATALILERARPPLWAFAASTAAVTVAIVATPIDRGITQFPYYEAHGLSILAFLNREWSWPLDRIETAMAVLAVVSGCGLAALRWLPPRATTAARVTVAGIAVALLGWNLTNEIYASIGEHDFSSAVEKNLASPHDWIDRAVGDGKVTILAQHAAGIDR
jgi:hypothetical protein